MMVLKSSTRMVIVAFTIYDCSGKTYSNQLTETTLRLEVRLSCE